MKQCFSPFSDNSDVPRVLFSGFLRKIDSQIDPLSTAKFTQPAQRKHGIRNEYAQRTPQMANAVRSCCPHW